MQTDNTENTENNGFNDHSIRLKPKTYEQYKRIRDQYKLRSISDAVDWTAQHIQSEDAMIALKFEELIFMTQQLKKQSPELADLVYFFSIAYDKSSKNPPATKALIKILGEFIHTKYEEPKDEVHP